MVFTITDVEQVQREHPDWQVELQDGKIVIMGPCDDISSEIGVEFSRLLANWVRPKRLGRVYDSSGGFILPNSDLRAPDVSFVKAQRLPRSRRNFVNLVPDLAVEIKSKTDRLKPLKEKINLYLELGTQVGILIDPDKEMLTVYRTEQDPIILQNNDVLTLPDLFPGWELPIAELWPPVFDDEE
ncbi:Uma2 family endonuclease [Iningainema tapete]|uniref:Uma2 family endonuclease n=1 Tax=Iningainema tapete BLCC-T55 TaxID=2748662 RepID=A0A8J7C708_9CYAN|nr:Uma2 family endonuclease [Iningainema tapete BLCC-T55]